jgi:hypothetical protein
MDGSLSSTVLLIDAKVPFSWRATSTVRLKRKEASWAADSLTSGPVALPTAVTASSEDKAN